MSRRDRLRRAGILCIHCIRNIAFYRSWYKARKPFSNEPFWVNVNSNFLDIAVLEWCKLFADRKGKHHYSKVVDDRFAFTRELLAKVGLSSEEFAAYTDSMLAYRDKFVAHLDELPMMNIPNMRVAKKSTRLLYEFLLIQEAGTDIFRDAPDSASKIYKQFLVQGRVVYNK